MNKKTVIVGAVANPHRYAYMTAERLAEYGHDIVPVGVKKGEINENKILNISDKPAIPGVDTITLYIGPQHQPQWYDYLLGLKPKRIIFNPGTENLEFARLAKERGIETVNGCTLVMLLTNQY